MNLLNRAARFWFVLLQIAAASALLAASSVHAADGTWIANASGTWSTTANWLGNIVASGSGSTANFTNNITADRTVTLSASETLTNVVFGDSDTATAGSWTLASTSTANRLTLAGSTPTITVNALGTGKTATISAPVVGTAGLTKAGAGTLQINKGNGGNAASFPSGPLTVSGGTLRVHNTGTNSNDNILSLASPTTINNGSTLSFTKTTGEGRITPSGGITFGASGGNTLSSDFSGNVFLIQGNWTFTSQGGATNFITNTAGGLISMQGTAGRYLTFNVADGPNATDLAVDMGVIQGGIRKSGAGVLTLSQANTSISNLDITAGTLELAGAGRLNSTATDNGSFTVNISNNGTLLYNGTKAQTFSGVMSGSGDLTKSGAATLTLSGANTFSGVLTIAAGTVSVATANDASADGPLGNRAGAVLLGSSGTTGTLEYTGATASSTKPFTAVTGGTAAFSVTDAAAVLTLSGAIDGDGDKSFGGAGSTTVSGAISGGNVLKTGAGTLTLDNLNGQANTTVSGGRLNINQFAALGISTGTLTMAAGTLLDNTSTSAVRITNPKSIALGNSLTFVGTNDLDLGEGTTTLSDTTTFTVSAGTLTLGGDVVGNGHGIVKEGAGTLVLDGLSGSNSFTGNSTINSGTLVLGGLSTLGGGSSTIVTLGSNGFLNVGATASLGNVTVAGFTGNLISNTVVNANQDFTVSQTLTSANANFNGVQTINSGVTVTTAGAYLGTVPASATAGRIVFENGATLAATAAFDIKPNQGVSLASGTAAVSVVGGQAVYIESAVAGSGGLRKIGAGNLRLTGSNSYQGGTVIDQGILGISSGAALGDVSGSLTINGAILAAATNQDGSGSGATIDAARTVLIGNGTTSGLHAQNGLTLRYDGAIAEIDSLGAAGGLQFGLTGPREGTVILGGANTYRGDTILSAGTLKLGSGGSFANSPTIVVGDAGGSAAAVLDLTEKTTFAIGAGQTLKGKGTVLLGPSTALTIDGLLSPGNSPGLLTWSGSGAVTLSGTTLMEIWGTSRGTNPGYDAIDLENGTALTFGGILNLDFSQTFADGTTFNLFTPDGTSSLASTFSSITMVGSAYNDLTFTNNAGVWTTNTGAANQSMTFNSATGTLIIVVPEPGTLALASLGLAGLALAAGRQRLPA